MKRNFDENCQSDRWFGIELDDYFIYLLADKYTTQIRKKKSEFRFLSFIL